MFVPAISGVHEWRAAGRHYEKEKAAMDTPKFSALLIGVGVVLLILGAMLYLSAGGGVEDVMVKGMGRLQNPFEIDNRIRQAAAARNILIAGAIVLVLGGLLYASSKKQDKS